MLSYFLISNRQQEQDKRWMRIMAQRKLKKKSKKLAIGQVESHFLDSGAFTLWTKAAKYAKENRCSQWDYYDTDEFYQYMDDYAKFVKKYQIAIDLYANVDAVGNAEITYRNQKYLEKKHNLSPVPVVHYKTDLKWLKKYMDEGYELIGLGGLVGSMNQDGCQYWIDRAFDLVCDQPSRLPKVKLHGFGVTSYELLLRYPWWSVDSSTWTKVGAFGGILVPHKRRGKFVFTEQPYVIKVSQESPTAKEQGRHYLTMSPTEQRIIREWLDEIRVPLGKMGDDGEKVEEGVMTDHSYRRAACLLFFEKMRESLPEYPWPFRIGRQEGFVA